MNGLVEIQGFIKDFINKKKEVQAQIAMIEEKRTQLAEQRNQKKKLGYDETEVNELGRQISELGNQSQELQNSLDFKVNGVKTQINLSIDNQIAEGIRKIRKINEEVQELEKVNASQKERNERYQLQRQEFYLRFGRMPELSENAKQEAKRKEEERKLNVEKIEELELQINDIQSEITLLAKTKREFKNGNWNFIFEDETQDDEFVVETSNVEEIESIEEIYIEAFEPVEEIYVEEFQPIEELHIDELQVQEFNGQEELFYVENIEVAEEKNPIDEIEELAKSIVEEIATQQIQTYNIDKVEEKQEEIAEDIVAFEQESEKKEKVIIPLFGQRATISTITIKIEEGKLVYKAQMSDDEEIKIYPSKLGEGSVLLRDKQNRAECKEILVNYAVSEYRVFDKKVINKIDPLICELLIECAERYGYNAQELIYNYAMSFSYGEETDTVPGIIYNLSYLENSELTKKEKSVISRICKNARKNNKIEVIESFSGFKKLKYLFKRLFAANNVKVLPEAKY